MEKEQQCNKLPKAFKKKWVEALRSGKYRKTKHTLYENGAYCVLGVAARVAGYKPSELTGEADLVSMDERVPDFLKNPSNPEWSTLIDMNDGGYCNNKDRSKIKPMGFKRLADYIERNL